MKELRLSFEITRDYDECDLIERVTENVADVLDADEHIDVRL